MKKTFCHVSFVSLCFALLILLTGCSDKRKNYEQAKTDCMSFLENNKADLTELSQKAIIEQSAESEQYEKYTYYCKSAGDTKYVIFDFDAQGAIGGQYWGIYYSSDNEFCDEYGTNEFNENCRYYREKGGNNFFATERLSENWFFFYQDYDGNAHGLNWGEYA